MEFKRKTSMAENTTIATYTWSPWLNIVGKRRRTSGACWRKPLTWNQQASGRCQSRCDGSQCTMRLGHSGNHHALKPPGERGWGKDEPVSTRPRVSPSKCDVFEDWTGPIVDYYGDVICETLLPGVGSHNSDPITMSDLRRDMFSLFDQCLNLNLLLATTRPENIRRFWPCMGDGSGHCPGDYRSNVWLIYSASDQESLDVGADHLLECRDLMPVLGLSLEPPLGPVDLKPKWLKLLNWLIVGAESGPKRRPMEIKWLRDIVDQCKAAGVACFVKQGSAKHPGQQGRIPDDLWAIKEFPEVES